MTKSIDYVASILIYMAYENTIEKVMNCVATQQQHITAVDGFGAIAPSPKLLTLPFGNFGYPWNVNRMSQK